MINKAADIVTEQEVAVIRVETDEYFLPHGFLEHTVVGSLQRARKEPRSGSKMNNGHILQINSFSFLQVQLPVCTSIKYKIPLSVIHKRNKSKGGKMVPVEQDGSGQNPILFHDRNQLPAEGVIAHLGNELNSSPKRCNGCGHIGGSPSGFFEEMLPLGQGFTPVCAYHIDQCLPYT